MGSSSKDSGRGSSSKRGSGPASQQKKGKNVASKKGKETYQQPIEEEYEGYEDDEYAPVPPGSSVFGGTGDWTQSQLQAARTAGHAEDKDDISLSSGYSQNTQASQATRLSNLSDVQATGSGAYYEPSQSGTGSRSAYPTNYYQETPNYSYDTRQTSDPSLLAEGFSSLNIQTSNQNYQYANLGELVGQANEGVSVNTGFGYDTYNTGSSPQYGNSSRNYKQQTPRALSGLYGGNTYVNLQAAGHSNKKNQKLLGAKDYRVHRSKDYVLGHVLKTFWFEPQGSTSGRATLGGRTMAAAMNEGLPGKVRRFIIVQTFKGHSIGVPISTYGDQGTKKNGCHPEVHAMIYTNPKPDYLQGEMPLPNPEIRMAQSGRDTLAIASRINYTKRYTIEHNLSVCFIGRIAKESSDDFWMTFNTLNTVAPPPQEPADEWDEEEEYNMEDLPRSTRTESAAGGSSRSQRHTTSSSQSGSKGGGKSHKDKKYRN